MSGYRNGGFRLRMPVGTGAGIVVGLLVSLAALPATAQKSEVPGPLKRFDGNGNGIIEREEARGPLAIVFDHYDEDKNGRLEGEELKKAQLPARVALDTVIEERASQTTPVIGRIVARQSGAVAARVGGPVEDIRVDVGDRVKTGDIIAVLQQDKLQAERDRYAAQVAQRRAELATATAEAEKKELEMQRLEGIRNSAAFNQARYDDVRKDIAALQARTANANAQLKAAEAQLRVAAFELRDAEIRAPFDGVISAKHTEVGAYVNASSPIVTLINDRIVDIEAPVPAPRLAGLTPGTKVSGRLDNGTRIDAEVRAVIPDENPQTRTRPVRFTPLVDDATGRFAANQSVTVEIPYGEVRDVVTVSKDAITKRGSADMVFVVTENVARPRPVQLGFAVGNRFSVESGLAAGDVVVVRGNENLRPGQFVFAGGRPANGRGGG